MGRGKLLRHATGVPKCESAPRANSVVTSAPAVQMNRARRATLCRRALHRQCLCHAEHRNDWRVKDEVFANLEWRRQVRCCALSVRAHFKVGRAALRSQAWLPHDAGIILDGLSIDRLYMGNGTKKGITTWDTGPADFDYADALAAAWVRHRAIDQAPL